MKKALALMAMIGSPLVLGLPSGFFALAAVLVALLKTTFMVSVALPLILAFVAIGIFQGTVDVTGGFLLVVL